MYTVKVSDAIIGQIISEPVISSTGVLLCNPGTPVSNTLKKSLPKFGITEIPVNSIIGEKFDSDYLDFNNINNMMYASIKHLDIEDIVKCANALVGNLNKNEDSLLLSMLYEYDESTYTHSFNVASLALTCGIKLGLSLRELYLISYGSLVHDIGKYKVPLEILNKHGKLTNEEFDIIKKHPQYGNEMLCEYSNDIPSAVKQIVLQHHENHDGSGYPRGLKDYHIYKLARIVHIADCYEALCSKRAYKDALPRAIVREYMLEDEGKKFDPILLRKFLNTVPMYLVGEEIEYNGVTGVVIDTADGINPFISISKDIVRLSDFQNELYIKKKVYEECRERLASQGG